MDKNQVFEQVKKQQNAQKLSMDDVIQRATQKEYPGGDWKAVKGMIAMMDKANSGRVIRAGNTLMAYFIKGKGTGDFVILNADPPQKAVQNIQQLFQAAKKAGFSNLSGTTTNPETIQLIKASGLQMSSSIMPRMTGKEAKPSMKIQVQI